MDFALFVDIATRAGLAGALLMTIAIWALHKGYWYPSAMVDQLLGRVTDLQNDVREVREELQRVRLECRSEVEVWERRTFDALGVTDRITKIAAQRSADTRRQQTELK